MESKSRLDVLSPMPESFIDESIWAQPDMSVISYPPFTKLMAPSSSGGSKTAQDPGEIPKRFKTTISVCS
jgi:hypothetical protein